MEQELQRLQAQLHEKKKSLDSAYSEAEKMSLQIESYVSKKQGLCIRTLNRTLMTHVLGYVGFDADVEGGIGISRNTCKYWRALVEEAEVPMAELPVPALNGSRVLIASTAPTPVDPVAPVALSTPTVSEPEPEKWEVEEEVVV